MSRKAYYFYVVKHFPPKTGSYKHDYENDVLSIANWLAGKCTKRICRTSSIFDKQDREWICVCVVTKYKTKLDRKKIAYDGAGNFEDVSGRFSEREHKYDGNLGSIIYSEKEMS